MNSTRRKHTKAAAAGAVLLAVMLTVSACGGDGGTKLNQGGSNAIPETPQVDQLPEQSGILESGAASNDGNNSTDNEDSGNNGNANGDSGAVYSDEGVYTGAIDSNSIEIETKNGADAYRITEQLSSVIDTLPPDAKVKFEYTKKFFDGENGERQLWLKKIELIE